MNLKAKNTPQLWVFVIGNICILFWMIFPTYLNELSKEIDVLAFLKILGYAIAPILLFLLNGLVSSDQKAVLVFWRFKDPLPGAEAFTNLSKKDYRINREKLKEIYGVLPKRPKDQNKLWYKIYQKNSSNLIIQASQGGFLLARDLTSLSVLFGLFLGIPVLIIGNWPINFFYFGVLILQYLVVCRVAQIKGRRFVNNVLAIESSQV
ncbi:hypothetical protein AAGF08_08820 [Algoriphagus sp. SE2]|uniref:hypothetical protein n=1 Tax=Algoriphagus sp. SE2 TaxID=3141536 RepID=UPI0031CD4655